PARVAEAHIAWHGPDASGGVHAPTSRSWKEDSVFGQWRHDRRLEQGPRSIGIDDLDAVGAEEDRDLFLCGERGGIRRGAHLRWQRREGRLGVDDGAVRIVE